MLKDRISLNYSVYSQSYKIIIKIKQILINIKI